MQAVSKTGISYRFPGNENTALLKMKVFFTGIVIMLAVTGCIQDIDDWLITNDISFKRNAESKYFSKDYLSFDVQSKKNNLSVTLTWDSPSKFPFPVDDKNGDTLTESHFIYCFKENGCIIPLHSARHYQNNLYNYKLDSRMLMLTCKDHNFRNNFQENLNIPMYYFNSLKKGKHEITVDIYQDRFSAVPLYSDADSAGTDTTVQFLTLVKGSITFKLTIPEIYRTDIYTNGLSLRSDSGFTPAGMDFSLFTSGYPDIYWELFHPVSSSEDLSNPRFISSVSRTNTEMSSADTVVLYHYKPDDRIIIGVYDQDVISRDDFLGDWYGSISTLAGKNGNYRKLTFDNVAWFSVRADSKGVVNN